MSDQKRPAPGAIVVPGPSVTSEGQGRAGASLVRQAVSFLAGAAEAIRTLKP